MKITIEPTEEDSDHPTVTISMSSDHLDITEVLDELVVPALVSWGFHPASVADKLSFHPFSMSPSGVAPATVKL